MILIACILFLSLNAGDFNNNKIDTNSIKTKTISKKEEYKQMQLQQLFKQGLPPKEFERRYNEIINQ